MNELQGSGELPWRQDTYKSADCIKRAHVSMQMESFQGLEESSYVSIDVRRALCLLSDIHFWSECSWTPTAETRAGVSARRCPYHYCHVSSYRHLFVLGAMLVALNPRPTSPPRHSTPRHFALLPQCPQASRQTTSLPPTSLQYSMPHQTSTKRSQNKIYKHTHLLPRLRTLILLILS
jgi:hypothetical protein